MVSVLRNHFSSRPRKIYPQRQLWFFSSKKWIRVRFLRIFRRYRTGRNISRLKNGNLYTHHKNSSYIFPTNQPIKTNKKFAYSQNIRIIKAVFFMLSNMLIFVGIFFYTIFLIGVYHFIHRRLTNLHTRQLEYTKVANISSVYTYLRVCTIFLLLWLYIATTLTLFYSYYAS